MILLKGFKPILKESEKEDNHNHDKIIDIKITGLKNGEKLYEELMFDNKPIKTRHRRIFSSSEHNMPILEYQKFIKELKDCCEKNNLNKLKDLLSKKYVKYQKQ